MLPILYSSYETGAPVLNVGAGSMIAVLDACLVTGFNSRGVVSMTVAGNVCTVVTATPHGYAVDQRLTHAGATASALNGSFAVDSVPSTTSYTFSVTTANVTDTTAGMTASRTPLGWIKEFAGTNKAIYKMSDPQSYGQRLRIVDDASNPDAARVIGVDSATGIDAFSGAFPDNTQHPGGGYWPKGGAGTNAKFWLLIGDERGFYFVLGDTAYVSSTSYNALAYYFGDVNSFKLGEANGAILFTSGGPSGLGSGLGFSIGFSQTPSGGAFLAKQHTGLVGSALAGLAHASGAVASGNDGLPAYPSPLDNGAIFAAPTFVLERVSSENVIRGTMPGMVSLLNRRTGFANTQGHQIIATTDGSGRKVAMVRNMYSGGGVDWAFCVDVSESWRG